MIKEEQALLARIIDLFAQKFGRKAVLRGGMVLRILGSPRMTNDLDYVFVPFSSKKDIVNDVVTCLQQIEGSKITQTLNSKCLRIVVSTAAATVQVEAKVAKTLSVTAATTALLSPEFGLPKRAINIVDLSVAMADKMAAWNERRLIRDLYDIWFYLQMNVKPDLDTLQSRLSKPVYSKLIKKNEQFDGQSVEEFYQFIRTSCASLTDKDIEDELSDYLPAEECLGLAQVFRAALVRLR